jgi:pimeloyl-ACP methyl ester carboxylesterase
MAPPVRAPPDIAFGPELADGLGTPYRPFRWFSRDGLALAGRDHRPDAADDRPPVVCLPGLARSCRDFEPAVRRLTGRLGGVPRRVVSVDFRGRGASERDRDPQRYTPTIELDDVLRGLDGLGIDRAGFFGTSRGGIVAMLCGVFAPDRLAAVILGDIGPVIEVDGLLRIKRRIGRPLPAGIDWEELASERMRTDRGLYPRLDRAGFLRHARRLYRDVDGRPAIDHDPRLIDGFAEIAPGRPLPDLWTPFRSLARIPLLVVRGALSDILSTATVTEMAARHPDLEVHEVPDQGHAPLFDDEVAGDHSLDALVAFLDRVGV